ncbi:MAG: hypothetical protein ACTHJH_03445 [Marmoricola sp.]
MHVVEIVIGLGLVVLVFVDAFMTTLSMSSRAGPLTQHGLAWAWRLLVRIERRSKGKRPLTGAGTVLLIATVLTWVIGLWIGWFLVFLGSGAVELSSTHRPAGALDVGYFAGFNLVTLGTGDVVAATPAWRFVSAISSFTGLFLVTLAITYLISVVSAVVARRTLSTQIRALGGTPEGIVRQGWVDGRFSSTFLQQMVSISTPLITLAEQHIAYPVLHYFHSGSRFLSAPLAIASLDDALLLMRHAVAPDARPDRNALAPPQAGIDRYVDTATAVGSMPREEPPAAPDREQLRAAGIPLAPEADWVDAVAAARGRREALHRLVVGDGWRWQDLDGVDGQ